MPDGVWLFGYGSLIWRPDFEYRHREPARAHGYVRRFWQGSHDHRGVPEAPGRVVTLVPDPAGETLGMAFLLDPEVAETVMPALDHREKNGYERLALKVVCSGGRTVEAITYVAHEGNHAWLGPAPLPAMAAQIFVAEGPSGANRDYVFELAAALRALGTHDDHVFALATELDKLGAEMGATCSSMTSF